MLKESMKTMVLILSILFFFGMWLVLINIEEPIQKESSKMVMVEIDKKTVEIPLDEYIFGVVASEMPATFSMEALKAQSVVARTYVKKRKYEVDDTTNTQVYQSDDQLKKRWGKHYKEYKQKIQTAINATKDEILTYQGEVIDALYYSSSCGRSANADEYWNTSLPYLISVDSHWDEQAPTFLHSYSITKEELVQALHLSKAPTSISIKTYDSGYVEIVRMDDKIFTGKEVREQLSLSSSSFTITAQEDGYGIVCKGYGHGVGMSQYGANALALQGWDYQAILKHYYQGVEVKKDA